MPRCASRNRRRQPACDCLVHAFRTHPAQVDLRQGCASPECPVKSLDSITLHQFLEAIGGPGGADHEAGRSEDRKLPPIFRAMARRCRRLRTRSGGRVG